MDSSILKGQTIDLLADDGRPLRSVRVGLAWDSIKRTRMSGSVQQVAVDLDVSAILVSADGEVIEIVYYGHLSSIDLSVVHHGDNLTGERDVEDESVAIDFTRMAPTVAHIVVICTSYSNHRFDEIQNAAAVVVDPSVANRELARFRPTGLEHTAMVIGRISRTVGPWTFTLIGDVGDARTPDQFVPVALASI